MDKYTPKLHPSGYMEMLVDTDECPCCSKRMMHKDKSREIFPVYILANQYAQMKAAGMTYTSRTRVDNKLICEECEKSGKADFLCALCEQRKPSDKKHESFGDPAEHLCIHCYESVPAKVWEEKGDQLREEHRYD